MSTSKHGRGIAEVPDASYALAYSTVSAYHYKHDIVIFIGTAHIMPSLHVLVVEDDDLQLLFVAELLDSRGHELGLFTTGSDALAAVKAGRRFDVAIVDLGLPDVDGLSLIRALRQHMPALPMLVCTGFNKLRDSAGKELRASTMPVAILTKPCDEAELVTTVEWLGARCER